MVTFEVSEPIHRSQAQVFDFTCRHVFANHRKWEPEVIEWRAHGEPVAGTSAVMVRKDNGKIREVPTEFLEYRPDSGMTFLWRSGPLGMRLEFRITPVTDDSCTFTTHGDLQLFGPLRLLTPIFGARSRKIGAKLVKNIRDLLEDPALDEVRPLGSN
jgi:hypothetical protein